VSHRSPIHGRDCVHGRDRGLLRNEREFIPAPPVVQMYPKAGLLAPKDEKLFVKGIAAYMNGRAQEALGAFQEASARDEKKAHVGEEFFEAMSLVALERYDEAILPLEEILASESEIPDALMLKYRVTGQMQIQITPIVSATVPMSTLI
jgi:tetratricopeptide (TPR) repeat protein